MKNIISIFILMLVLGCHSVKIKDDKYKISKTVIELGLVGFPSKDMLLRNQFTSYGLPVLKNKVRLDAQIVGFDTSVYKIYKKKFTDTNEKNTPKLIDSIAQKQDYLILNILDRQTLLSEYNSDYNRGLINYLRSSESVEVVTSLVIYIPEKEMLKIKASDAFYLVNTLDHKYLVQLYKEGKKAELIDLNRYTVLAYLSEGFCWDVDSRGNWFPADFDKAGCHGKLLKKIKQKEQTNIYKM